MGGSLRRADGGGRDLKGRGAGRHGSLKGEVGEETWKGGELKGMEGYGRRVGREGSWKGRDLEERGAKGERRKGEQEVRERELE